MKYALMVGALVVVMLWCCPHVVGVHDINGARHVAAKIQIDNFKAAVGTYRNDVGTFPTTTEGLQALRTNPGSPRWNGPYLPRDVPMDPWGTPYLYTYPGLHGGDPDIASYGADRQPGGEGINADVVSWQRR